MNDEQRFALSKVPEVTLGFWVIKILATTLGETGGDAVTMTLDWGYLAGTALFALIGTIWSLASPVLSAPDEAAHAVKAAAVVRGQFLGDETGLPAGRGTVQVPALFVRAAELPLCYAPTGLGALQPDGSLAPSAIPAMTSGVSWSLVRSIRLIVIGPPSPRRERTA